MKKAFAILTVALLATGIVFAADAGKKRKKKCAKTSCCKKTGATASCCAKKTATM